MSNLGTIRKTAKKSTLGITENIQLYTDNAFRRVRGLPGRLVLITSIAARIGRFVSFQEGECCRAKSLSWLNVVQKTTAMQCIATFRCLGLLAGASVL